MEIFRDLLLKEYPVYERELKFWHIAALYKAAERIMVENGNPFPAREEIIRFAVDSLEEKGNTGVGRFGITRRMARIQDEEQLFILREEYGPKTYSIEEFNKARSVVLRRYKEELNNSKNNFDFLVPIATSYLKDRSILI